MSQTSGKERGVEEGTARLFVLSFNVAPYFLFKKNSFFLFNFKVTWPLNIFKQWRQLGRVGGLLHFIPP